MTPIQTDEALLNKVAGLLRKAERSDNEFESAIFTAKAQELMTRYSIDAAVVSTVDREGRLLQIVAHRFQINGSYASRKVSLAHVVAKACGCRTIFTDHGAWSAKQRGYRYSIEVWGTKPDTVWAETLYESLCAQMESALKTASATRGTEDGRSFGTAFVAGFTSRVFNRLTESADKAEREAQAAADLIANGTAGGDGTSPAPISVALVLASKADRVEEEYKRAYPKTRNRRCAGVRGGGYTAGREAGSKATIARGGVNSNDSKALGA